MSILIIEVGGSHIECVYSLVHYLHLNKSVVFLACNKKLGKSVPDWGEIAAFLELPDDPTNMQHLAIAFKLRTFIRKHKIQMVVFNTTEIKIVRNLLLLLPRLNYTGIVHNSKKLEKSFTFTKIISLKMKKFFVLSDYLKNNVNAAKQFKVASFYPIYFPPVQKIYPIKPAAECWITIPGGVSTARRDYLALLQEVKSNTNLPENIKFVLLGHDDPESEIQNLLHTSPQLKKHFISFDHYLSYDLFHSYLQQSDFILPLLKMKDEGFYGSSRISGSFNLGLAYQLPFLLPASYQANDDIEPYSTYYTNMQHLLLLIEELRLNQAFKHKLQNAYENGKFNDINLLAHNVHHFVTS